MTDEDELFTLRAAAGLPPAYGPLSDAVLLVAVSYTHLTLPTTSRV